MALTHRTYCSMFDDPDDEERKLYVQYWQGKLKNNKDISFPDSLASEIVDSTARFSFAYLKEVLYVLVQCFYTEQLLSWRFVCIVYRLLC